MSFCHQANPISQLTESNWSSIQTAFPSASNFRVTTWERATHELGHKLGRSW